jgi:hypothetical protein
MNTSSTPYSPSHAARSPAASDTITDTARGAVDAVKETVSLSQAGDAASKMADTATRQVTTFASELEAMAKRNPLARSPAL